MCIRDRCPPASPLAARPGALPQPVARPGQQPPGRPGRRCPPAPPPSGPGGVRGAAPGRGCRTLSCSHSQ
eukprot:7235972-Alexandrium_andersonii.AAC.1